MDGCLTWKLKWKAGTKRQKLFRGSGSLGTYMLTRIHHLKTLFAPSNVHYNITYYSQDGETWKSPSMRKHSIFIFIMDCYLGHSEGYTAICYYMNEPRGH